jgi:hypothetical protein
MSRAKFNEASHLKEFGEGYKLKLDFYPSKVLSDMFNSSREKGKWLK